MPLFEILSAENFRFMRSAKNLLTPLHRASQEQATLQAVLLMQAKQKKRAAADLAAGRTVRISFQAPGAPHTDVYPARVAAFACLALGTAVGSSKGICFSISSQGRMNQAHYAPDRAQLAILALMAHTQARYKWYRRGMARWRARYAREAAQAPVVPL